jgi:pimeloyl-ACP methyl ester carboxylesterase
VTLAGGRRLGYREFGDPAGYPVIGCHGGLVCGLDLSPADSPARALALRLIAPDRPGIDLSDPQPARDLLGWAGDVRELADQLGLKRFGVLGWSMGGQYALACARALAGRVTGASIIAGCLPLNGSATYARLNPMDRRFSELADRHPHEAKATFQAMGELAHHAPHAYNAMSARGLCQADAQAVHDLPDPGLAGMAAPALLSGDGMVEEYRAWLRPWGFELADVAVPTAIWHGDDDTLVPPEWARAMAGQIPGAVLHHVPGAGHMLAWGRYEEILRDFLP